MPKIMCYENASRKNEIQQTYNSGTSSLKAGLEVSLSFLKVRSRNEWMRPKASRMNKCKEFPDFFEIRFKADNTQQRPIGFFYPNDDNFIILLWAIEKGNKLNPEDWCKKANDRRKKIIDGTSKFKCLKLDGDPEC